MTKDKPTGMPFWGVFFAYQSEVYQVETGLITDCKFAVDRLLKESITPTRNFTINWFQPHECLIGIRRPGWRFTSIAARIRFSEGAGKQIVVELACWYSIWDALRHFFYLILFVVTPPVYLYSQQALAAGVMISVLILIVASPLWMIRRDDKRFLMSLVEKALHTISDGQPTQSAD